MAIARDTSLGLQDKSPAGGTFLYTCTGSDRLLLVWVFIQTSDAYTNHTVTVTYNSVSMTQLAATGTNAGSDVQGVLLFGLLNPTSGSNTVSVSVSGAGTVICYAQVASYTGVKQSGLPDSVGTNKGTTSDLTVSTTVVASNCWLFTCSYSERAQTYTSGATVLQGNASQVIEGDSNATVAAGSQSVVIHETGGPQLIGGIVVSFAPTSDKIGPLPMHFRV